MKDTERKFIGKAFVGIDVHKNNWKVCLLGDLGFKKQFSCDPDTKVLVKSLRNLLPNFSFECAYEAGFSGFWLHDQLKEVEGFNCIVVNPADIPTSDKERAQKEDKRDARKIATQLKAEGIKGIYVPNKQAVGLREIQRLQFTITKDLSRCKIRVKSFLMRHEIVPPKEQFPSSKYHWSGKFIKWLKSVEFDDDCLKFTLDEFVECVVRLRARKVEILKELRRQIQVSGKEKIYNQLISIKGIGLIGGVTILTEVVDIKRFRTYEKFHSYIGLVPSTNNSDTTERIRGVTNRSNRRLRNMLIEASWIAIRYDTDLFHYYHQLKERMNTNKAIIRIAKKMATKIRYKLLELENNEPQLKAA
jgi:transposase